MLPDTVAKTPKQQLDIYLLGEQIGTETFTVAKQTDGYRIDLEAEWKGERWTARYDAKEDWTTRELTIEKPQECKLRMFETGGYMQQTGQRPGKPEIVLTREPMGPIGWFAMRPVISQHAVCFRASRDQAVTMMNFPAFHVELAPRVEVTLSDGRIVDKVRVDDLIDVFCKGNELLIVHYATHGFLAVRPDYAVIGKELAKNDPKGEPWAGELACPERSPK